MLKELYKKADFKNNHGMFFNMDCMELMKEMILSERERGEITLTITDIPYDGVNRKSNGLRSLDKGNADIITFDLHEFLNYLYEITSGTIIVFCSQNQLSEIFNYFDAYAKQGKGTVRQLVWSKSNPSPMNGDYIYLSACENAVWFKKRGATFNAHCKKNVFTYPCGKSKLHPTTKNLNLLEELILDNSNENDIIFDPCAGSASALYVAQKLNRRFIGAELDKNYFDIAKQVLTEGYEETWKKQQMKFGKK